MKILFLVIISTLQIFAHAGQESGGGGHPCKSDFMQIYNDIKLVTHNQPQLYSKHPYLSQILSLLDSPTNLILEIREEKIIDCPNAQNPIACSRPQLNKIEIYCTSEGWGSLLAEDKIKIVMHELLWWSEYDDSNNYYSTLLFDDLKPAMSQLTQSSSAEIKKSAPVSFEVDLSEIDKNSVPIHFLDISLSFQCSVSEPSGRNFLMNILDNPWISETKLINQNKKLSGTFLIKKDAQLRAPLRSSTHTISMCSAGLELHYSYLTDGKWRTDNIFMSGASDSNVGSTANLTDALLDNTQGEYKIEWVPTKEDPTRCYLGIQKISDGPKYKASSISTHLCPI